MAQGQKRLQIIQWFDRRTAAQRIFLLFLAGGLSAFAFAPFYMIPLLGLCYPILLLTLFKSIRLTDAFLSGWWFSFGQLFFGLTWIASAFDVDDRYSGWVGYFAVAGLAALLAIYSGLVTGALWRLFKGRSLQHYCLPISVAFVVLWSIAEWMRGHLFTGFPWNLTGYVWGFSDVMLQSAALWGIYGLGIFTLFLAVVPYVLLYSAQNKKATMPLVGCALAVIVFLVSYGFMQLSEPTKFNSDVKLKIVQANISQNDKWDREKRSDNFIKYLKMSRSKPEEGITHVIWPETAVIYYLDTEPSRRYLIADMLNDDMVLMTGFPRVKRTPDFQAWNSFAMIDSEGNVGHIYDKHHLVPFGEYSPDFLNNSLSFLGLGMLVEGFSYSRGEGNKTLHQQGKPSVGVLICYEIIFPGAIVDQSDRPDWLLNITNDAWYGTFNGPYQHLVQTRVRAIEEGLPIIRSAGTGISAVIDAYGRIVKKLNLKVQGNIVSELPTTREGSSLYAMYQDWLFLGILLLFCGFGVLIQPQGGRITDYA